MKIVAALILSFMSLAVLADDSNAFNPPDHLLPLDARGVSLYQGYGQFLKAVYPKPDFPDTAIYIWPAFKPGQFISIVQTNDEKSYYLFYAQDTKPKPTVMRLVIPTDFAKAVADKLKVIIRDTTRYSSDDLLRITCTDGTDYVFESGGYLGETICPAQGSIPAQLELVSDKMIELAGLRSATVDQQNKKMAEIVAALSAIKLPGKNN